VLVKRYLTPSDFSTEETWRLVDWCKRHGADEFTIDCVGPDAATTARGWRRFEKMLEPFALGQKVRERMSGPTADELTRATELWELNDRSISALQHALPAGLIQYEPREDAWFENPVLYRGGDLMLGVLSHEAFAVLRVSDLEAGELASAGFISHDSLPRIG
jgi:hypothetical protein